MMDERPIFRQGDVLIHGAGTDAIRRVPLAGSRRRGTELHLQLGFPAYGSRNSRNWRLPPRSLVPVWLSGAWLPPGAPTLPRPAS